MGLKILWISLFSIVVALDAFPLRASFASPSCHSTSLGATAKTGLQEPSTNRRNALKAGGLVLSSLLLGGDEAKAVDPQTILITGSNSGIGYEAAKILAERGHTLILACRTLDKAKDAAERIKQDITSGMLIPAECDLSSFESIDKFVTDLKGVEKFDVLCLNAGLALNTSDKQIQRTAEGFELTVGINHFGHFYLNHLLLPKVNKNGGKIVVTASGVHDPDSPGGAQGIPATLGNLKGLERDGRLFEMVDGEPYNGDKAYKDSKLCNVLFTRELQRRLAMNDSTKGIVANCFSPGLITSSGFFRYQNQVFSKVFDFAASKVFGVAETPEWGGASLAYMTGIETQGKFYNSPPGSSKYGDAAFGREFKSVSVSIEAQDDSKAKKLWELSEKLVGIKSA